jgi:purine-binding chemotaxis protein CheW
MSQYVGFTLDDQSYCLKLSNVERVIHIVDSPVLPKAPNIVMGILNMGGEIIPVVNIRKRFNLPPREISLSDQLIISNTAKRKLAILVDTVTGVIEIPQEQVVPAAKVLPNTEYISSIIKLPAGMVLIHDIDTFLSLEEEHAIDPAIADMRDKA